MVLVLHRRWLRTVYYGQRQGQDSPYLQHIWCVDSLDYYSGPELIHGAV